MIAYKFLSSGAIGPFTRFRWPTPGGGHPGRWVDAGAAGREDGIHACRPEDLPYWFDDELWRAELEGDVRRLDHQVVARRGRLLGPVEGWGAETRRAFGTDCAERLRSRAVGVLRAAGHAREAGALGALREPEEIADGAAPLAEGLSRDAANVVWLVRDCAKAAASARAPAAGYVAARAAIVLATAADGDRAFEAERAAQARWLAARLALENASSTSGG